MTLAAVALVGLLLTPALTAPAQASEPFIAEVILFAGNFAPRSYAFCNGQLLPISQNTALFSLIGTTYGGDGRTTTALPDLRNRAAVHPGQGPGLTRFRLGERFGNQAATHTVAVANMPNHNHTATLRALNAVGNSDSPAGNVLAQRRRARQYSAAVPDVSMSGAVELGNAGGGQAFSTRDPTLGINFCIALTGTYPSRS